MDFSSPSRFAGSGGFNASQSSHDSPSTSSSGAVERKKRDLQSVTPVTVRQVLNGDLGEKLIIDGKDMGTVELVGHLSNVQIKSNVIEYQFHDLTGIIAMRTFLTNDGDELSELKRKELEDLNQAKYVRVYGNVRAMNEERVLWTQAIRPVADMNAVTYHALNVLHTHLRNTKGPLPSQSSAQQRQQQSHSSSTSHSSSMDSSSSYSHGHGNGSVSSAGGGGAENFNGLQQEVLNTVQAATHDSTGCSVSEVIKRLQTKFTVADIQQQIAFLTEEGHLFTTVDEQHVKRTVNG